MNRAWVTGPQGKLGVAAVTLLLAAAFFPCLVDGNPTDHQASMVWCSGAATLSLLGIWLAGPCVTGRVVALPILSPPAVPLHLLDPPPKLAIS